MATDLTPVISDFELGEKSYPDANEINIRDDDDDDIPPLKDTLKIPDAEASYDLRKRTERKSLVTCIDWDTSGNFDPEEEERRVKEGRQHLAKSRRLRLSKIAANKNKLESEAEQRNLVPSPQNSSSRKVPTVKASKPRSNAKSRNHVKPQKPQKLQKPQRPQKPASPLKPEDYLTKEDFAYLDNLEELRVELGPRSPSTEVLEDSAGHKGVVTQIKTSFTHPIEFGIEPTATDCSFCELGSYGFVGSFEKEPYCIRWDNGLGFTQLTGGDAEIATSMCQSCTMERVQIAFCEHQEIRCVNPNPLDFEEALENLLALEEPATIKEQLLLWCSMCFSPAKYACSQPLEALLTEDGEDREVEGCGLKLCAVCETKLREVFAGDLDAMVAALDQESKAKDGEEDLHGKVRADVGFLSKGGLLVKSVENAAEENTGEDDTDE